MSAIWDKDEMAALEAISGEKFRYTTRGPVRGSCEHKHRTIRAAWECLGRDSKGCGRQGGYSDREVCRVDGTGEERPLEEWELEEIAALYEEREDGAW